MVLDMVLIILWLIQLICAINNGVLVDSPKEYPFAVALFEHDNFICSGSLIAPNVVLTAAHCVDEVLLTKRDKPGYLPVKDTFVVSNLVDIYNAIEGPIGSYVKRVYIYPKYNTNSIYPTDFDIAILILKDCIPSQYIPIATQSLHVEPYTLVTTIGFGGTGDDFFKPQIGQLRSVTQPINSFETCRAALLGSSIFLNPSMTPADVLINERKTRSNLHLCHGGASVSGAFHGDSGGPLFVETDSGRVQIGITSFAPSHVGGGSPSYALKVSSFSPWILEILNSTDRCPGYNLADSFSSWPVEPFEIHDRPTEDFPLTQKPKWKLIQNMQKFVRMFKCFRPLWAVKSAIKSDNLENMLSSCKALLSCTQNIGFNIYSNQLHGRIGINTEYENYCKKIVDFHRGHRSRYRDAAAFDSKYKKKGTDIYPHSQSTVDTS